MGLVIVLSRKHAHNRLVLLVVLLFEYSDKKSRIDISEPTELRVAAKGARHDARHRYRMRQHRRKFAHEPVRFVKYA